MRPLLVASIPHTGTMFTLDLLPGRRGALPGPVEEGRKYWCHLHEPHAQEAMRDCLVIVPLRDFAKVKASWTHRGLAVSHLYREWGRLAGLQDVFFFPIDSPERDARLAALSRALGVALHTDWMPVNSVH